MKYELKNIRKSLLKKKSKNENIIIKIKTRYNFLTLKFLTMVI